MPSLILNLLIGFAAQAQQTAEPVKMPLQVPIFGFTETTGITPYIAAIFKYGVYALVPIVIVVIMLGGITWITSAGEQAKIKKAKEYITSALIGLVLVFVSYYILSLINLNVLKEPTIAYIEAMPEPVLDGEFEKPSTFIPKPHPVVPGEMSRIFQGDYRNVNFNCPTKTVSSSGCGVVSSTMVLNYYGVDNSVEDTVDFMSEGGYIGCNVNGTSPSGFAAIARANGLNYQNLGPIDANTLKSFIDNGEPIIVNVGEPPGGDRTCKFTSAGHYLVVSGWDETTNQFIIDDPGSKSESNYNGTWEELATDCTFKGAYYIGE